MVTIVVQAGGESRRMGQDKALLPFLGRPLIERVVERIATLADEVIVTTNRPENYAFLDLRLVPDLLPGRGALGGLYTALSAASEPLVGVVACDMPFVSRALLEAELEILAEAAWKAAASGLQFPPLDAVIPRPRDGNEPFHAFYRRSGCLPLISAVVEAQKWRVDAWFQQANIRFLNTDEIRPYAPRGLAFWNVNTPEEFHEAEELARKFPRL